MFKKSFFSQCIIKKNNSDKETEIIVYFTSSIIMAEIFLGCFIQMIFAFFSYSNHGCRNYSVFIRTLFSIFYSSDLNFRPTVMIPVSH